MAEYQRALQLRPAYAIAHNNLGTALLQLGRPQPALASFREAARIDPRLAEAHLNVGLVSRALGDFPEAIARFRRALELNPDWVTAMANLASLHAAAPDASVRNPVEAVRLAERAVTLTRRRDANTLDVLAVAHAAAGDFDRAIAVADEALALNPPAALAAMIRRIRSCSEAPPIRGCSVGGWQLAAGGIAKLVPEDGIEPSRGLSPTGF